MARLAATSRWRAHLSAPGRRFPQRQSIIAMKIALLGAESTGKTRMAHELAEQWRALGRDVLHVPEVLREWCEREGRTPRPDEQSGIAQEQARRADAVRADEWLVADTTPLMTAIYSDMLFTDASLYAFALAHQRQYDLTLVTGLDIPWVADGLQRDGPHVREPVDTMLRTALARGDIHFQVVYGTGAARLENALHAIDAMDANGASGTIDSIAAQARSIRLSGRFYSENKSNWRWPCDKCSDPDCEHTLFTQLMRPGSGRLTCPG